MENSTKNDTTGVITVSSSTTTQLKVGTDGKTTKTVSTSNGTPLTQVAETGTNTVTTTQADGTIVKTVTDSGNTSYKTVTTTAPDGTMTVTTTDGTKTTVTTATTYGTPTSLTGATDASALKDKIVSFVNDYNKLLSEINTKIYETRDKNYMPLTDEQKKAMTDDQITAWEKRRKQGCLEKITILKE